MGSVDRSCRHVHADPVAISFLHGIPVVEVGDLDATVMRSAIVHHGAIVVRDLLPAVRCAHLVRRHRQELQAIACYRAAGETDPAWFDPIQASGYGADMQSLCGASRVGPLTWPTPPGLCFELIEAFDNIRMKEIVGEYLRATCSSRAAAINRSPARTRFPCRVGSGASNARDGCQDDLRPPPVTLSS